jgi:hypothetical protein
MGSITSLSSARISPIASTDLVILGSGFGSSPLPVTFEADLVGEVKEWADGRIVVTTPARSRKGIVDWTGGDIALDVGGLASSTLQYLATREGMVVNSINRRLAAINAGNGGFYNWSASKITSFQTDPRTWDVGAGFPRVVHYLTTAEEDPGARCARFLSYRWVGRMEAVAQMRTEGDATQECLALLADLLRAAMSDLSNDGLTESITVTKKEMGRIDGLKSLGSLLAAGIEYVFDLQHVENDATQNLTYTSV